MGEALRSLSSHGAVCFRARPTPICLIHALPDRLFPARCCWRLADRSLPLAAVHAVAAGAVFQPRWWVGVCIDRLADHAAAPGDTTSGALGCVQPGGSNVGATGAVGVCVTGVAGIKDSVFTESIALLFLCSL